MLNVSVAFPWRMLMKGLQFLEEGGRKEGRKRSGWQLAKFPILRKLQGGLLDRKTGRSSGARVIVVYKPPLGKFFKVETRHQSKTHRGGEGEEIKTIISYIERKARRKVKCQVPRKKNGLRQPMLKSQLYLPTSYFC